MWDKFELGPADQKLSMQRIADISYTRLYQFFFHFSRIEFLNDNKRNYCTFEFNIKIAKSDSFCKIRLSKFLGN